MTEHVKINVTEPEAMPGWASYLDVYGGGAIWARVIGLDDGTSELEYSAPGAIVVSPFDDMPAHGVEIPHNPVTLHETREAAEQRAQAIHAQVMTHAYIEYERLEDAKVWREFTPAVKLRPATPRKRKVK